MPERQPVVITRPLAQARPLAERLRAHGRAVEILPLLEILPLADEAALATELARLQRYRMVAFVSPNAIDAFVARVSAWPAQVAIAVMGEGSRAALVRHAAKLGGAQVISPRDRQRTDSETLLAELDLDALRGADVLIVRGDGGRQFLADALQGAGVQVSQVAAYRRVAATLDAAMATRLRALVQQPCAWLITSSEALRVLLELVGQLGEPALVVKMLQQQLFIPHARIVQTARELGFACITQTASGDEALIAALQ